MKFIPLNIKISIYRLLGKTRRGAARLLRFVPGSKAVLGVTRHRIASTKQWINDSRASAAGSGAVSYKVIYESKVIVPSEPKCPTCEFAPVPPININTSKHYNYWDKRSGFDSRSGFYRKPNESFDEVFLANIPNGFILGPSGAVLTPERELLEESIWTWDDWLINDRSQTSFHLPPPLKLDESLYVAVSNYSDGYPHWLMEVLPRLFGATTLVNGSRPTLVFAKDLNQWQTDSINLLGFGAYERIGLNGQFIQARNLYFPSYVGRPGMPHPDGTEWIRTSVLGNIDVPAKKQRFYITRRLATKRKVINEEELLPVLSDYGFEVIEAEKLSFAEQVRLFSGAEAVVSPHGAGLANLMWAPRGCKVLEILDRDYVNDHYYNLSSVLGLDYFYQLCDSFNAESGLPVSPGQDHVRISAQLLQRSLEAMFRY